MNQGIEYLAFPGEGKPAQAALHEEDTTARLIYVA